MTKWGSVFSVCVLSAALLVGGAGGAIAAAEPDSGDSTAAVGQPADGSGQDVTSTTEAVTSAEENDSSGSLGESSNAESASSPGPMTIGATTITEDQVATNAGDGAAADITNSDVSGSTSAVPAEGQSGTDVGTAQSKVVTPPADVVASETVIAPAPPPAAPVSKAVAPVTKAVVAAANAVGSLPAVLALLPSSPTPVTDIITALQDILTSVGTLGASLARMPSDLASLLGFPGMAPGEIAGINRGGIGESLGGAVLSRAVSASVLPPLAALAQQRMVTSGKGGPSAGNAAEPTLGGSTIIGLGQELSESGIPPVAPNSVAPTGALSVLKHTVRAVFVAASLTALAAVALPGLLGLLMIGTTGITVGYRQAKAGATLRSVGIARFARQGPLGVVRSGSLIALSPRASRAARRQPSRNVTLLEPVA